MTTQITLRLESIEEAIEYIEAWGHDTISLNPDEIMIIWISGQREILTQEEVLAKAVQIYRENGG